MNILSEWNKPPIPNAFKVHMSSILNPSEDPTLVEGECEAGTYVIDSSSRSTEISAQVPIQIPPPTLCPADYLKLREPELKVEHECTN